jgi:hypothetical protein
MSKEPGPREKALREMREAKYAALDKAADDLRTATRRARKVADEARALSERIKATSERMKNKPAKPRKAKR